MATTHVQKPALKKTQNVGDFSQNVNNGQKYTSTKGARSENANANPSKMWFYIGKDATVTNDIIKNYIQRKLDNLKVENMMAEQLKTVGNTLNVGSYKVGLPIEFYDVNNSDFSPKGIIFRRFNFKRRVFNSENYKIDDNQAGKEWIFNVNSERKYEKAMATTLTARQLEELLNKGLNDSDDDNYCMSDYGGNSDADDNISFVPSSAKCSTRSNSNINISFSLISNIASTSNNPEEYQQPRSTLGFGSSGSTLIPILDYDLFHFSEDSKLNIDFSEGATPLDFFSALFNDEIYITKIVEERIVSDAETDQIYLECITMEGGTYTADALQNETPKKKDVKELPGPSQVSKIAGPIISRKRKINSQKQGLEYLHQYYEKQFELKKKELDIEEKKLLLEKRKCEIAERQCAVQEFKVKKKFELEEKKLNCEIENRKSLNEIIERQEKLINILINKLSS
ncbi:unnamed protein product [Diabrotica balteata]|uniref:Uncharacterized protein n=1 Tax=Diabrotica balteata TaxID=107213 RepID=A0A9N9TE46_DIABA|nr:unnamed protein product [Diabrotica balteata]